MRRWQICRGWSQPGKKRYFYPLYCIFLKFCTPFSAFSALLEHGVSAYWEAMKSARTVVEDFTPQR
jgi:hypothetical protein